MKSKPFQLWILYKELWQGRYQQTLFRQPQHLKWCKEFVQTQEEDGMQWEDIQSEWSKRARFFLQQEDDWITGCKHNLHVFIKHFHRWIEPPKPKQVRGAKRCGYCNEIHPVHIICFEQEYQQSKQLITGKEPGEGE